ncbi:MAG: type IV pilin protein [Pseudomonadota bacterium]
MGSFKKVRGFTLIEIMITVAIIGILAAIALPMYGRYVLRSDRTEAQSLLSDAAARQERYFAQNNVYIGVQDDIAQLGLRNVSGSGATTVVTSENDKYRLTVAVVADDGGYTLTATPTEGGTQTKDLECLVLTLNAQGARTASGTSSATPMECWR